MSEHKTHAEKIAKVIWDSGQRMAMQIAFQPLEMREEAFQIAVESMKETADELSFSYQQRDGLIELQMKFVRDMVRQMEAAGQPQGGNA